MTGATGYIGSVVAEEFWKAGHQIVGLAGSDASAEALEARGVEVVRGDLGSAPALTAVARAADGVIHTAFNFGGGDFAASVATEVKAVRALIGGLGGSDKPLVVTSGSAILGDTGDCVFDEEPPLTAPGDQIDTCDPGMRALQARIRDRSPSWSFVQVDDLADPARPCRKGRAVSRLWP